MDTNRLLLEIINLKTQVQQQKLLIDGMRLELEILNDERRRSRRDRK